MMGDGSLTGPIAPNSVSSNTFSIADFEGSTGGGLTSVGWSAIISGSITIWQDWENLELVLVQERQCSAEVVGFNVCSRLFDENLTTRFMPAFRSRMIYDSVIISRIKKPRFEGRHMFRYVIYLLFF